MAAANKTQPTDASVAAFFAEQGARAEACRAFDALFQEISGFSPVMWGPSIVGYGRYHYVYESGREGDFLATGFAPRTRDFSLYIMPGYQEMDDLLARLGPHKKGKACLYIKSLEAVDREVLAQIIRRGLDDLNQRWSVEAR